MTIPNRLSKNEFIAIVAGFTIVLVILLNAFHPYGRLRMTYDSQDLIEASTNLQTYLTEKNKDGHSYLVRAPLHPFLLSFFHNKMLAMWWVNIFSLITSLFLIFKISRLNGLSNQLSTVAVIITAMFYPWLLNFQFFWTEPVFIALILCLCFSILRKDPVLLVFLICLLLFFTRKSGIFFFTATAVFYVLGKKWINAILLFTSGVMTFVCWQWLEFSFGSTGYFGVMLGDLDEYSRIFYLEVVSSWFLPMTIPLMIRTILVLVFFVAVFYSFKEQLFHQLRQRPNVVLLSLGGVYTLIFVTFTGASGYEDAERYLNVVFPLWIMIAVSSISKIVPSVTGKLRIFILTAISLWLLYTFLRTVHHLA